MYAPQQVLDGAEWNDAGASRVSALCNLWKGEQVKFITGTQKKKKPLYAHGDGVYGDSGHAWRQNPEDRQEEDFLWILVWRPASIPSLTFL